LIVNELVFNALKHAFPDDRHGSVQVELTSEDEGFFTLRVKDDGVGLPAGLQVETENPPGTLGLKLVRLLVEQLQGSLQVRHEGGTVFKIVFPAGHLDTSFRK
jgi:two-component sensor histidine kinase